MNKNYNFILIAIEEKQIFLLNSDEIKCREEKSSFGIEIGQLVNLNELVKYLNFNEMSYISFVISIW